MSDRHYNYLQPNPLWLDAFDVTENDIKRNRQGHISRTQRRRIWRDRLPAIIGGVGVWLLIGLTYTVFRSEATSAVTTQCLGVLLILSLLVAMVVIIRAWYIMATLQVQVAVGIASTEERTDRYGGLFLHIDGRNFELTRDQFNIVQEGMPLAVYYIHRRKRVIAIEPIVFHDIDKH